MQQLVLIIHVLVCVFLIVLVLIQHGKGADIGAAFGSGASNTIFGSQGSGSFIMKLTCVFAIVFFATCLLLGYLFAHPSASSQDQLLLMTPAKVSTTTNQQNTHNNPESSIDNVPALPNNSAAETQDGNKPHSDGVPTVPVSHQ
jgi:preprotein translocase subunit SecG